MGNWSDRVKYQGKAVNLGLRYQIDAANKILARAVNGGENEPLTIIQGSWSGAAASAGTHRGSGAIDITAYNWRHRERVFRLLGMAMWHRPRLPGVWQAHMHGITDGDGGVSSGAAAQVSAYHRRRNGLAGNGADTGYRMAVFPLFVFPEKPHGKPGRCWVATASKSYEQPTPSAKAKRTLTRGQTFEVVAVVNVAGTYWGISPDAECVPMVNLSRTPVPSTTTPTSPADLIDLRRAKLTTPFGKEDHPTEIKQPGLNRYADSRCFFVRTDSASKRWVVFRVKGNGVTTSGSSYPRCELREMELDGDKASWDTRRDHRLLEATYRVAGNAKVVVAQIHDAGDDLVMVSWQAGRIVVEWSKGKGKGSTKKQVGTVKAGDEFTITIEVEAGEVVVKLNGKEVDSRKKAKSGCYQKAGAYLQDDDNDAWAEVSIEEDSLTMGEAA
jgi:hypothetical protein